MASKRDAMNDLTEVLGDPDISDKKFARILKRVRKLSKKKKK